MGKIDTGLLVATILLAVAMFLIGYGSGMYHTRRGEQASFEVNQQLLDECKDCLRKAKAHRSVAERVRNDAQRLLDESQARLDEMRSIANKEGVEAVYADGEVAFATTYGYEIDDHLKPEHIYEYPEFQKDACLIAQTLWGECRGLSTYEQSMVVWCILNRVDDPRYPDSIEEVIKQPNQFHGYKEDNPIDDKEYSIAVDVLMRWSYEKYSVGDVGRTLPEYYTCFYGKHGHNWFRNEDKSLYYRFAADDPYGDNVLTDDYISNYILPDILGIEDTLGGCDE